MNTPEPDGSLAGELRHRLGDRGVVSDPDLLTRFEADWMGRRRSAARLVAKPSTTAEVAAVLAACARAGATVVPQGGNTGLVGGGIPRSHDVVLSTERLAGIGTPDMMTRTISAGAGVTLSRVRAAAFEQGLDVPMDLASRDVATVGGMVATNAGGLRVFRYGHMRSNIAGVEAVLGDGTAVSRMAGLRKDTAGYDLEGMLCGSEGTLGVITHVLVKLVPLARSRVTIAVGVAHVEQAQAVVTAMHMATETVQSAEIVFADGARLAGELFGIRSVLRRPYPCELLLELVSTDAADDLVAVAAGVLALLGLDDDAAVSDNEATRQEFWAMRERQPEIVVRLGGPRKLDVSVPLRAVADLERRVRAALGTIAGITPVLYGHVGDGSLHVNVSVPDAVASSLVHSVEDIVFAIVAELGGSISAEHGVGTDKVPWLGLIRSPDELQLMQRVKDAFDPSGLMNPGVIFER